MQQIRILANDGIDDQGAEILRDAGFLVETEHRDAAALEKELNQFQVLLVRSATKVRKELINQAGGLKMIGRGGVGMDNIDVEYARSKGIHVFNTPAASSLSVAELAMGHVLALTRFLHRSNREMNSGEASEFKDLKKAYAGGRELRGKMLGVVGLGRIGQEMAGLGLAMGMKVQTYNRNLGTGKIHLFKDHAMGLPEVEVTVPHVSYEDLLRTSDIITFHCPFEEGSKALLGARELDLLKPDALVINTARGGVVDEGALLQALDAGKLGGAGLDVFQGEPIVKKALLQHPRVSVSPHIGASTLEAQENVGKELAQQIISFFER